jgi:undecaprenyl-diphosphatase
VSGIDNTILLWITSFAGRYAPLDLIARYLANDFLVPAAMALIGSSLWFVGKTKDERRRNQWGFIFAIVGLGISALVIQLIHSHFFRARPYVAFPQLIPQVQKFFYEPSVSSFPSTSATVTFAFAFGIWLENKRIGVLLLCMAALMSISRVYIGIHYPSDILAGAVIGIAIALILSYVLRRFLKPLVNLFLVVFERLFLA